MHRVLLSKLLLLLLFSLPLASLPPIATRAERQLDELPSEKQGAFPIHLPSYSGVEQLIVLNNRWVVVVTTTSEEIFRRLDEMTSGGFSAHYKLWKESELAGRPRWESREYVLKVKKERLAEARLDAGELELDRASYYTVYSQENPPAHPKRATRNLVSLGGNGHFFEMEEIHWAHYSFLELPFPMRQGSTYRITLENGKSVSFLYDEMRTISRAIKVNQSGYLPEAEEKYAYLGGFLYEFGPLPLPEALEFFVVDAATGEKVLSGPIELLEEGEEATGESIYRIDFSALKQEGEFFISVPSVGRSWTFKHGPDAYGEPFYTFARALYHQRSGMGVDPERSGWPREAAHLDPVYESEHVTFIPPVRGPDGYEPFDVIGATIDYTRATEEATGGWYDAADWDKQLTHYANLFNMLNVFEFFPSKFSDGQLNLPESGNGIPDLLDEVQWGLLVWKKSMDSEGGVSGSVETWTHPKMRDPDVHYAYSRRTRWNSLIFAAAASQFSRLVAPFDEELAKEYADSAKRAYRFGIDQGNSLGEILIHARRNRGEGEPYEMRFREEEESLAAFKIHASLQLFLLEKEPRYLEGLQALLERAPPPYKWPFTRADFSPWFYFSLFEEEVAARFPSELLARWKRRYLEPADELVRQSRLQPYRQSWPRGQDYWMDWGATVMSNQAKVLLIAHRLTGSPAYLKAALHNLDFMLGNNAMGMSWATGLGFVYPIDIQHEMSELDGIMDPVPGIPIYGMTGRILPALAERVWQAKKPDGSRIPILREANRKIPLWRRFAAHPHINVYQNEFTIHETLASSIFSAAYLLPEGWQPQRALLERGPRRDGLLFGYWYLP